MAHPPHASTPGPAAGAEDPTRADLDHLFSVTYEELRRLAAVIGRDDPGATLNPTALVNQTYLKLAGTMGALPESELHFKRIAARAMRQVLVDSARRRRALKRGGDEAFVTLDDSVTASPTTADELLGVDAVLDDLARLNPRQAQMVEYRYFGGFDVTETAALLEVSESTVARDWRAAKAWLALRLQPGV